MKQKQNGMDGEDQEMELAPTLTNESQPSEDKQVSMTVLPKAGQSESTETLGVHAANAKLAIYKELKVDLADETLTKPSSSALDCLSSGKKNGPKLTFPDKVHALVSYATENSPDVLCW